MNAVRSFAVDHLPRSLWRPANLRLVFGGRLHFCYEPLSGPDDAVRTIEWNGNTVATGRRSRQVELSAH